MTLLVQGAKFIDGLLKYVPFDTAYVPSAHVEGTAFWDGADHTLSLQTDVVGTSIQVGHENVVRVVNKTGSAILNGKVVYCSGAQGNRPKVTLARADSSATSSAVIGVATNDIANNANGYITTFGLVRDIDTSAFAEGDIVYLSPTVAGALTNVKPSSDYRVVRIGFILNAHHTQGLLLVCVDIDPELDVWDDLRFPAQGINPPGAASDPSIDSSTGVLLFSGTQDNVIAGIAQMPHAWNAGTNIRPHLHVRFPTASTANTRWKLEYSVGSPSGDFGNTYGSYTALPVITVQNPNNAARHVIASFDEIPMSTHSESAIVMWRVSRLANSDASDTNTSACALLELDFHYRINKHGTTEEF